jgi:hypothetical protein
MEIVSTRKDNQLMVWDVPLIPIQLTRSESEIVALAIASELSPKVQDADLLTLSEKISNIVGIRLNLRPRSIADEEVFLQTLEADINKFPQLTTGEILRALTMGLDGDFDPADKDIFFTSSKFVRWIRAYVEQTKKPVMSRYAQFVHQLKEPIVVLSDEEKIKSACDVANMYARARRKDPENRAVGAAVLWQNLEALGIHTMPTEDKTLLKEHLQKVYPQASNAEIVILCQNAAYNKFIQDLVDFDMMLSDEGKTIEIEASL